MKSKYTVGCQNVCLQGIRVFGSGSLSILCELYIILPYTFFTQSPCRMAFSSVWHRSQGPGCFQYIGVCQVYIVTIFGKTRPMKYCLL
jgi:hypothetical protein